jgi:hypothetical protein
VDDKTIADAALDLNENDPVSAEISAPEAARPSWWDRLITAETGEGPLSSYRNHTINFTGDDGGARLARGMTGLFDNLNLAVVDLVVGAVQLLMRNSIKRPSPAGDVPNVGS